MAKCSWCNREMLKSDGCIKAPVKVKNGDLLDPIAYNSEKNHRCHDCGALSGNYHHPGCDMERCPNCFGQLIGYGCLSDE